jgi:hypothetical protein
MWVMTLSNAERQALWRERQKAKLVQSDELDRLRSENHRLRVRIAELESKEASADPSRYMPARYLLDVFNQYLSRMQYLSEMAPDVDPDAPDYPLIEERASDLFWLIVSNLAGFIDECRSYHPLIAEDLALWLGLHPDPAGGLTYKQFADKLIEAKVAKDDLAETFYYVARTAQEALDVYQTNDIPMNFSAAVRHRKALKLLGLWRSISNE